MDVVMKNTLLAAALAATLALAAGSASAQDAAASNPLAPAAQARTDTPQYQKFSDQMKVYKEGLKQLRALKAQYQEASPEEKDKIVAEFEPLVAATAEQQKQLVPLALEAYKSIDGQNDELRAFLCSMLQWSVAARENYELGYSIAKPLFEYPLPPNGEELYAFAAYAAFCTMNLEDAEKWRDIAKKNGSLAKIDPNHKMQVEGYLNQVLPTYKPIWEEEQAIRAKEAADDNLPRVLIKTTAGDITVELFLNEAPNAVNNFLMLSSREKVYVDKQIADLSIKCADRDQSVSQLSGGNKQKVVFGKWIGRGSEVLILDCPTRGVDIGVKRAMYQLMAELKKEGKSIIMISEEMPELMGMSDRLIIMKDGRITKEFERSADLSDTEIIKYMI